MIRTTDGEFVVGDGSDHQELELDGLEEHVPQARGQFVIEVR